MDIERLKKLRRQIVGGHWGINGDDLKLLYNLLPLVDEAIARQSVTSEDVQEAIEQLMYGSWQSSKDGYPITLGDKTINLAIAALQEYQPWVSVSERLPNDGVPVFVTYIGFSDRKPYSDGVARWSIEENGYNGGWLWELDRSEVAVEITHWKPLPEPPKGE